MKKSLNKDGKPGKASDRHYKCYHGNRKTLTISKAMNYSFNGMYLIIFKAWLVIFTQCLSWCSNSIWSWNFVVDSNPWLQMRSSTHLVKSHLSPIHWQTGGAHCYYQGGICEIECSSNGRLLVLPITNDQSKFEWLFIKWVVTCDQPFDEVQKPEFISMMEYGQYPKTLFLPKRDGVCQRVIKLGEETIQETKDIFAVHFFFIILQY